MSVLIKINTTERTLLISTGSPTQSNMALYGGIGGGIGALAVLAIGIMVSVLFNMGDGRRETGDGRRETGDGRRSKAC